MKREVVRIVTPGTVTEESLLEATQNNFLASLSFIQNDIGLAWVDISTGLFQTQKCGIEQLGAALSRILPTEILISDVVFQKFNEEKYIQSQWSFKTLISIVIFIFVLVFVVKDLEINFIKVSISEIFFIYFKVAT